MTKKYLTLSIIILVLAATTGYFALGSRRSAGSVPQVESVNIVADAGSVQTPNPNAPVKEFTVNGTNYSFDPSIITVNKGDNVKITFKDDDGTHNFVVDGYNVSTNVIGGGSQDSITFVADKAGTFEYYCSVGSHRDLGMTGQLIVK